MKKIIEGKRYDTETATELCHYWNGVSASDFGYMCETLYKTRNGRYFLHGEGGAMSKYAEYSENGRTRSGGEDIIPVTEEEAREWVMENANSRYEEIFGEVEEA